MGNLTAPGGERARVKNMRAAANATTTDFSKMKIKPNNNSNQPSTPRTIATFNQELPDTEKAESHTGLIHRGNLRFKKIL